MERWLFPTQAALLQTLHWPLWVSQPHISWLYSSMLRCSWVWHIINIHSLSWRAIIISIDGFNVPPSMSFHYYTVEWSTVVNNQMNEFGYLDPIIESPPFVKCTIKLYWEIWAQADMVNSALMGLEEFFLPSPEHAHTTVTYMGRRRWVKTSRGNKSIHKSSLC